MTSIYDDMISNLNNKICEVHNQHPHAQFTGNRLKLLCCCDDFKVICYNELIVMLKTHGDRGYCGILRRVY